MIFYLYGGYASGVLGDLWSYDSENGGWAKEYQAPKDASDTTPGGHVIQNLRKKSEISMKSTKVNVN